MDALVERLRGCSRLLVLTGAGVSTDSGIVDYRDDAGQWKHREPMRFQQFTCSLEARQRYWARSLIGFGRLDAALPNAAHRALATLEQRLNLELLVTQNVDGLHQKAGSRRVLDLHGRLDVIECLKCGQAAPRRAFQRRLADLNPAFGGQWQQRATQRPDGDADLDGFDTRGFLVPPCDACGGILKPGVVFFGESVPARRVEQTMQALGVAEALLVVGSSLMVFSGYRFVRAAHQRGIPILIVNRGTTRADQLASLKLALPVADALPAVLQGLG